MPPATQKESSKPSVTDAATTAAPPDLNVLKPSDIRKNDTDLTTSTTSPIDATTGTTAPPALTLLLLLLLLIWMQLLVLLHLLI